MILGNRVNAATQESLFSGIFMGILTNVEAQGVYQTKLEDYLTFLWNWNHLLGITTVS